MKWTIIIAFDIKFPFYILMNLFICLIRIFPIEPITIPESEQQLKEWVVSIEILEYT